MLFEFGSGGNRTRDLWTGSPVHHLRVHLLRNIGCGSFRSYVGLPEGGESGSTRV
jgi:hypothetical protein